MTTERRTPANTLVPAKSSLPAKPITIYGKYMGELKNTEKIRLLDIICDYSNWEKKYSTTKLKEIKKTITGHLVICINKELFNFSNKIYNADIVIVSDKTEKNCKKLFIGVGSNTLQCLGLKVIDDNTAKVYLIDRNPLWIMNQMGMQKFDICTDQPSDEWTKDTLKARAEFEKGMKTKK